LPHRFSRPFPRLRQLPRSPLRRVGVDRARHRRRLRALRGLFARALLALGLDARRALEELGRLPDRRRAIVLRAPPLLRELVLERVDLGVEPPVRVALEAGPKRLGGGGDLLRGSRLLALARVFLPPPPRGHLGPAISDRAPPPP